MPPFIPRPEFRHVTHARHDMTDPNLLLFGDGTTWLEQNPAWGQEGTKCRYRYTKARALCEDGALRNLELTRNGTSLISAVASVRRNARKYGVSGWLTYHLGKDCLVFIANPYLKNAGAIERTMPFT